MVYTDVHSMILSTFLCFQIFLMNIRGGGVWVTVGFNTMTPENWLLELAMGRSLET